MKYRELVGQDAPPTGPANNIYPGDGFSVFEEYWGFMVQGTHSWADPQNPKSAPAIKDFFVYSELGIGET